MKIFIFNLALQVSMVLFCAGSYLFDDMTIKQACGMYLMSGSLCSAGCIIAHAMKLYADGERR